jgi:hypothetical protein
MTFWTNLVLFPLVFLPAIALVGMVWEGIAGAPSPTWRVGWNPLLWLLWTAPWHLPLIGLVPVLHLLARVLARPRAARRPVRLLLVIASPVLATLGLLAVYGRGNVRLDVLLPVALAGLAYGAVLRIPAAPAPPGDLDRPPGVAPH